MTKTLNRLTLINHYETRNEMHTLNKFLNKNKYKYLQNKIVKSMKKS
jgi:hypothetical protein